MTLDQIAYEAGFRKPEVAMTCSKPTQSEVPEIIGPPLMPPGAFAFGYKDHALVFTREGMLRVPFYPNR